MNNLFEKRFGKNYVNYQGKDILLLNNKIFERYADMFVKSDHRKADLVTIHNTVPRTYKVNPYATIKSLLLTQKNTLLMDYISEKFDWVLAMQLRDCVPCSRCFYKRDKMSIIYSICTDNHLMSLASKSEPFVADNIMSYIEEKYENLGRYYLMEKEGLIKVWIN